MSDSGGGQSCGAATDWVVSPGDTMLLGGALDSGQYASVGSYPGNNKMVYDPATGNVTLDTTVVGANVTGFKFLDVLADGKDVFAGSQSVTFPPGAFSTKDDNTTVSYASLSGGFSPGVWDLGNIALQNLTQTELLDTFSTADTYYLDASQGNIKQDWDLVVVPEPGALALLTLGGLAALWRRRRVPARFPTTPQLSPTSARGAGIRPRRRYAAGGCGSASAPARIRSSIRLPASRATT